VPFNAAVKVGGMIEIPAAVLSIGAFLRKLDFLSIGTNDLIQYTLAVDRSDEAVSHLYDPLHPAVLRLIGLAIGSATKAEVPIAVCGEMAGESQLTRLFLGLGLRQFSMHPSHLLGVKQRVLQTNVGAGTALIERIRRVDEPERLAALLAKLNA
jgi:phosphoenolpyruvate-protein phosphotransferase (PTS system enzyme I)